MVPPPDPGLLASGISYDMVHDFTDNMKGVVEAGVGEALTSQSPVMTAGRVAALSLIHLRLTCGVTGDGDLDTIWEEIVRNTGRT